MDEYWYAQVPPVQILANLSKSLDITLNGRILVCSSSASANLSKSLDITLNERILVCSM
uniref:Uncharacterized protein n=1 Tax=viral metagenome TaxID=1070528 RepID=A0A6C0C6P2_9ZZZZ